MGLLYENGPFKIFNGIPVANPSSWAAKFNLLYLDSPIQTGLSYGGRLANNSSEVGLDYATALEDFFKKRPEMLQKRLWWAGER